MNISVALSTTKFIAESVMPVDMKIDIGCANCPTCICEMPLLSFGIGEMNTEVIEHQYSQLMLRMAKEVYVDSEKKYVFIGENSKNDETGLVMYSEFKDSKYTIEFFKRWDDLNQMIFQFTTFGIEDAPLFAVSGFWSKQKWLNLEIVTKGNIQIKKD